MRAKLALAVFVLLLVETSVSSLKADAGVIDSIAPSCGSVGARKGL